MEKLVDYIISLKQKCRLDAELAADVPLTPRETALICTLARGERVRSQELARRIGLSASRSSRLVASLEKKGLITWQAETSDRRALGISLTKKGESACKKIETAKCGCEERLRSRLNKSDIQTIKKGLELLIEAL